ncbi:uncharacterized protein LOC111386580 [Olea europaea var. sylvestris]|uniref:uncharacterized protein LOC111386580 n=1 Tax=Olea europaea var. sylvestris TaxID=158386 RepID=UPI000C1D4BBB|nr:uncharacterized protein LOC111386580 [Olea europaea var. sylvestris]
MSTPLEAKMKTSSNDILLEDPSYYRELVGALQYVTLTRPDLSYSVNYVSQFMHAPTITHLKMARRILRYVKGTIVQFSSHTTFDLFAFSNVDWVGWTTTKRSTTIAHSLDEILSLVLQKSNIQFPNQAQEQKLRNGKHSG